MGRARSARSHRHRCGYNKKNVMSDDATVPDTFQKNLKDFKAVGLRGIHVAFLNASTVVFNNKFTASSLDVIKDAYASGRARHDQLAVLIAETIIAAQAVVFVGWQGSNVARAITELMCLAQCPPVVFSPEGELYASGNWKAKTLARWNEGFSKPPVARV